MAAKKASPAMEFIVDFLKKNKKATYAEVREAAAAKKIDVYPIMYGRAQVLLGLVEAKPRGQGKAALAKAAANTEVSAPGRPAKAASAPAASNLAGIGSLDGIIAAVKNSEQAKTRYRAALERIQSILGEALG